MKFGEHIESKKELYGRPIHVGDLVTTTYSSGSVVFTSNVIAIGLTKNKYLRYILPNNYMFNFNKDGTGFLKSDYKEAKSKPWMCHYDSNSFLLIPNEIQLDCCLQVYKELDNVGKQKYFTSVIGNNLTSKQLKNFNLEI